MPPTASLHDTLSALLPVDLKLTLYHISHTPIKAYPLYTPPPNHSPQPTTLETHFLAASYDGILCFAIEILVYISTIKHPQTGKSHKETTFFVSKADSSGYLPPSAASFQLKDSPGVRESTLRTISSAFIEHIVREHRLAHPNIRKTTISLFARSGGQYLFPDSESNSKKHILNDRGLIKWWCRVLDPILQSFNEKDSTDKAAGYLLVPGFDKYETTALFPPKTRQPALYPNATRWVHGHPLKEDPARKLTVREVIPHFPDDPKARFLEELNSENIIAGRSGKRTGAGGGWATVKTLDQFWEFMSFRQECSSGASTGFIWMVIEKKRKNADPQEEKQSLLETSEKKPEADTGSVSKEDAVQDTQMASQTSQASQDPPSSQTIPSSQGTSQSQSDPPSSLPTSLRFTATNYKKVLETLMCGEFGSESVARLHSRKWVDGAVTILGSDSTSTRLKELKSGGGAWGITIVGKREVETTSQITTTASPAQVSAATRAVNMLTVRKKHKRDDEPGKESAQSTQPPINSVNVLGAGLIRKKPKLDNAATLAPPPPAQTATVLAPGLVRKKPKPDAGTAPVPAAAASGGSRTDTIS